MKKRLVKTDLLRLIQGIIIGGGAILPGVSGGVLCAAFGLYMPLMKLFAHPFRELRKNFKMWLLVIAGIGIGFLGFAVGVSWLLKSASGIAMCLFAGLIFGTLPALFREAHTGSKNARAHGKARYITMICSFVLSFVLFMVITMLQKNEHISITPNIWWFGFCGVLWGLSFVVPGMTSSSILMLLGLYEPMTDGIVALDFGVIIPMGIGILAIALTLSRVVNLIFTRFYTEAYYAVIGVVVSSTLVIIPTGFSSVWALVSCVAVALLGAFASYFADKKLYMCAK